MWQELRKKLNPLGLELVTVALESRGWAEARRWIEAAAPEHPSLLDEAHRLDELYGIVNVPTGVWIDETGVMVRPPEPAFPGRAALLDMEVPDSVAPRMREVLLEARKLNLDGAPYLAALRDWAAKGAGSRYSLSPEEVLSRLDERSPEAAAAAAHFELGRELLRRGEGEAAVRHFKSAHRLQPNNWTYKRQAWAIADRTQSPNDVYETGWLEEVRSSGPENYYPAFRP